MQTVHVTPAYRWHCPLCGRLHNGPGVPQMVNTVECEDCHETFKAESET